MRNKTGLVMLTAYFLVSCASYTPQPMPIPTIQSLAVSRQEQGFIAGVDHYVDSEKSTKVFNTNLKQARILALQVLVKNATSGQLVVRKTEFILRLPTGKELPPAPVGGVAARLEKHEGIDSMEVIFWGGLIGLAAGHARGEASAARRADLRNKEFQDITLAPQESRHGLLFFLVPDDVRELRDVTLIARAIDVQSASGIRVMVPLGDLGVWDGK